MTLLWAPVTTWQLRGEEREKREGERRKEGGRMRFKPHSDGLASHTSLVH